MKEIDFSRYQDTNSKPWGALLEYIDKVADEEIEDFDPRRGIGVEKFKEIIIKIHSQRRRELKTTPTYRKYGSPTKRRER